MSRVRCVLHLTCHVLYFVLICFVFCFLYEGGEWMNEREWGEKRRKKSSDVLFQFCMFQIYHSSILWDSVVITCNKESIMLVMYVIPESDGTIHNSNWKPVFSDVLHQISVVMKAVPFSSPDVLDRVERLSEFNCDSTIIAQQFNETLALRTDAVRVCEINMPTTTM